MVWRGVIASVRYGTIVGGIEGDALGACQSPGSELCVGPPRVVSMLHQSRYPRACGCLATLHTSECAAELVGKGCLVSCWLVPSPISFCSVRSAFNLAACFSIWTRSEFLLAWPHLRLPCR